MVRLIDIAGLSVGTLTVIECVPSKRIDSVWCCSCNCGCGRTDILRRGVYLRKGIGTCKEGKGIRHISECKQCGKEIITTVYKIERGNGKYCSRECAADSVRKENDSEVLRKKKLRNKIYRKNNPIQEKARKKTWAAISKGKLIRSSCVVCGENKVEAHHSDYTKPLDIMWLCNKHHVEWHKNNTPIYTALKI